MRIIPIFLFLLFTTAVINAQEIPKSKWIVGPSIGYQHQEKSFLKASFWGLTDLGYANYLRFDAGANLTFADKKAYVIPEVGITYYLSAKGAWPFIKSELTPYTFTPKVGVGVFNIVEFGVGYGMKLQEKVGLPVIDGLNLSIGISLPLNYHLY